MTELPTTLVLGFGDDMKTNIAVRTSTRSTSVLEFNEMLAKRAREVDEPARESGGLIIETEHEMPALEALLESHQVKTAVIVTDHGAGDSAGAAPLLPRTWKERVEADFHAAVASVQGNAEVDERLWFLSALPEDELEDFVLQAAHVLSSSTLTQRSWERFLEARGRRLFAEQPHASLEPLEANGEPDHDQDRPPLFSMADLGLTFSEGAMGGPPPLTD
jgi:hypothetical protein